MDKSKRNLYREKLEVGVYYIYNDKHEKVYDTELGERVSELLTKLETELKK